MPGQHKKIFTMGANTAIGLKKNQTDWCLLCLLVGFSDSLTLLAASAEQFDGGSSEQTEPFFFF